MTEYIDPEGMAASVSDADALLESLKYDDEAVPFNNLELCVLVNALSIYAAEHDAGGLHRPAALAMRKLLKATRALNALALERLDG